MISGFEDGAEGGDAFIVAPDGVRAGLVWDLVEGSAEVTAYQVCKYEPTRWGVWGVALPRPMTTTEDQAANLRLIVAALRSKWEEWKRLGASTAEPDAG